MTHSKSVDYCFLLLAFISLLISSPLVTADADPLPTMQLYTLKQDISDAQRFEAEYDALQWQRVKLKRAFIKPSNGNSWVKVILNNGNATVSTPLLELASTHIGSVDFYYWSDAEQKLVPAHMQLGYNHTFSERPINYHHLIYPLQINALSQQVLYFNFHQSNGFKLNPKLWHQGDFEKRSGQELVFFGMIYGSLFMIVIYNLFIFLSLREKNHLLFVLFGAFTGLFISMQEGHFAQFIFPDLNWPKDIFFSIVTALMSFCFTFFCIYFLDIERWSKPLFRIILSLGSIVALFLVLFGINSEAMVLSHYTLLFIVLLYATAIWIGIYIWHKGVSSAGFFSLAIFLCSLGFLIEFFSHLSFVSISKPVFSYASLGNTAMILVFAFALADKMRVLQNEKLEASLKLIKLTEEKAQSNLESYRLKLHEVQLEREANEAKIESRAKSEFLATMSHEIRTPMNSVLGITELLEDTQLDEQQKDYVDSIFSSAKALLNVINDLLDYSRIESGQMELEARVFNLEKVIDDCINIFALRAAESKVNFLGQIDPGTPLQFKGDADKIRQITLNLLGVVFDFTDGHDVFLKVSPTGTSSINSVELRIDITSRGQVLSEEEKQNLLLPFHEQRGKRKHKSQELGLTVSRQLVDLMQGKLGIDIHEDSTTLWYTVRLIFPHSNEEQVLEDRSKVLNNRRLLVCDQNPDFIQSIQDYAESWGMDVTTASDGNAAADILLTAKTAYQVLMIDEESLTPAIHLAVRQSNVAHNFITSIIVVTRNVSAFNKEDMNKKGIQCALETPFTTSELYNTLLKSMGLDDEESLEQRLELGKDLSVLIAEDNHVNMMVIEGLLKKIGFSPSIATNGREAFELFQASESGYDLVFMDCEMPEVDGYDATRLIRQLEKQQQVEIPATIIALSAHSSPEYREQAIAAGMNDFLVKPVNLADIEALVSRHKSGLFHQSHNDTGSEENED